MNNPQGFTFWCRKVPNMLFVESWNKAISLKILKQTIGMTLGNWSHEVFLFGMFLPWLQTRYSLILYIWFPHLGTYALLSVLLLHC